VRVNTALALITRTQHARIRLTQHLHYCYKSHNEDNEPPLAPYVPTNISPIDYSWEYE